jgi:protoheme ferro-lyase
MKKHIAVVVSSHGEVDSPSFRAYYDNMKHIFAHVSEIMPIPKLARLLIPPIGAVIQLQKSKKTSYTSPMNRISTKQAEQISEKLQQISSHDFQFSVFNTFETTPPYTHDLLHHILHAEQDYDGVIALVMNPMESAFSFFTRKTCL